MPRSVGSSVGGGTGPRAVVVGGEVTGGTSLGGGGSGIVEVDEVGEVDEVVEVVEVDEVDVGAVSVICGSLLGGELAGEPKASMHQIPEPASWRPAQVSP